MEALKAKNDEPTHFYEVLIVFYYPNNLKVIRKWKFLETFLEHLEYYNTRVHHPTWLKEISFILRTNIVFSLRKVYFRYGKKAACVK